MKRYGVLVISHGSRSAEWVRLVDEAVAGVRPFDGVPIRSSFLEIVEGRLIQDGIDELERQGVTDLIVVPLFVSSGSTHVDEIRYALGDLPAPSVATGLKPFRRNARVHVTPPMDDDPAVARIVYEKLRGLSERPERENVLLVGHGSGEADFYRRWRRGMESVAAQLKELGGFARVEAAALLPDEAAETGKRLREREPERALLVAPLFLSEGYFTEQVIPQRLAGLDYRYNGKAMLPHPLVSDWMERQIARALRLAERER